jgi:hypothetical protein
MKQILNLLFNPFYWAKLIFGSGVNEEYINGMLLKDEQLELHTSGVINGNPMTILCTNKRLIFTHKGLLSQALEDFKWHQIGTVQTTSQLMMSSTLHLKIGYKKYDIKYVKAQEFKDLENIIRNKTNE